MEEHYYDLNTMLISQMALVAANALLSKGVAWVDLQPGDMTRYEIVIVAPSIVPSKADGSGYPSGGAIVTVANFGTTGMWSGTYVTQGWATSLWGDGNQQTGKVIGLFLNALAKILPVNFFSGGDHHPTDS